MFAFGQTSGTAKTRRMPNPARNVFWLQLLRVLLEIPETGFGRTSSPKHCAASPGALRTFLRNLIVLSNQRFQSPFLTSPKSWLLPSFLLSCTCECGCKRLILKPPSPPLIYRSCVRRSSYLSRQYSVPSGTCLMSCKSLAGPVGLHCQSVSPSMALANTHNISQ